MEKIFFNWQAAVLLYTVVLLAVEGLFYFLTWKMVEYRYKRNAPKKRYIRINRKLFVIVLYVEIGASAVLGALAELAVMQVFKFTTVQLVVWYVILSSASFVLLDGLYDKVSSHVSSRKARQFDRNMDIVRKIFSRDTDLSDEEEKKS